MLLNIDGWSFPPICWAETVLKEARLHRVVDCEAAVVGNRLWSSDHRAENALEAAAIGLEGACVDEGVAVGLAAPGATTCVRLALFKASTCGCEPVVFGGLPRFIGLARVEPHRQRQRGKLHLCPGVLGQSQDSLHKFAASPLCHVDVRCPALHSVFVSHAQPACTRLGDLVRDSATQCFLHGAHLSRSARFMALRVCTHPAEDDVSPGRSVFSLLPPTAASQHSPASGQLP